VALIESGLHNTIGAASTAKPRSVRDATGSECHARV